MKTTVSTLLAMILAASFGAVSLSASADAKSDAIAKACKDKKAGETVKVDGKDVKCPEKKK
jgi:hypothetical protein